MFVGCVNKDRIAGVTTPHDEDIVLVVADHDPMDLRLVVLVMQRGSGIGGRVHPNVGCSAVVLDGSTQVRAVFMRIGHVATLERWGLPQARISGRRPREAPQI